MIMGLVIHPQLSRQRNPGIAAAAQNNVGVDNNNQDEGDSDDDYVIDVSDEE